MPALRTITAVPDLPADVAVVLTRNLDTGDEVWQINRNAPVDQIVAECNGVFAKMTDQCTELRARGKRRALWLLLAGVVGLILPSPFRQLYDTRESLVLALQCASILVVGALLLLALREHVAMGRVVDED